MLYHILVPNWHWKLAQPILREVLDTLTVPQTKREWLSVQNNIERRIRWEWNCACKRELGLPGSDGTWIPELIQFGTTLLACCQSSKGLLCIQIGDGDIAWMSPDNNVHLSSQNLKTSSERLPILCAALLKKVFAKVACFLLPSIARCYC